MDQSVIDERYLRIAFIVAENSRATKRKVGAVLVKDRQIISEGYNGTPTGFNNQCEEYIEVDKDTPKAIEIEGKWMKLRTKPEVLHAESNAILKCAYKGISTKDSTLYVTCAPCIDCAKLIIQAGIKRVVYNNDYHNKDGIELLMKAAIKVEFCAVLSQ